MMEDFSDRYEEQVDPPYAEAHSDRGRKANGKAEEKRLRFVDMSRWDHEPLPEYDWSVRDRYPARQTVLFTGEGATGKGTVKLHLCAAHVLGRDWLGSMPEPGPAMFIDAEDEEKVLHIRLNAVAKHYGVTFQQMIDGGLHLTSLVGKDAVLGAPGRSGLIEPTALYGELLEAAGDIKPKLIAISSSADVFAGNELDRSQVRQFITLLNRIAILANGTVALIAHPSLAGINSGTGLSGTTQWHNSVRARAYMLGVKPEEGEQPDNDVREIVFKKNQYGRTSARVVVRYQNGMFLPVPGVSSLDQAARDQKAEHVFLDLLRRLTSEHRYVGAKPGANYAPTVFVKEQEAKGLRKEDLANAMLRLFRDTKIRNEPHGRSDRNSFRLAVF
jgi:RecA-family ATPase